MSVKKGAVGKNTQENSLDVAELKSLVKWEKIDGKKMLKKELWDVSSHYHNISMKDIHSSYARFIVYPEKTLLSTQKSQDENN
jgi:hypothetical protein